MKTEEKNKELYKRTDEVIHFLWDPIGISDEPYARNEYYSYLPNIFSLLLKTTDGKEVVDEMCNIEINRMGLTPSKDKIKNIVEVLLKYKKIIFEEE